MAAPTRTARAVVDLEGDEVALVHADEGGAGGERPLELGLVVHLDQGVEPELGGQVVEVAQLVVVEGGDDEQHGVGAHEPGVARRRGGRR